ncbi:MFS transporter [Saccharopolyspora erythraea NRRL 2338]|uniref:Alpha-ketoglutarate permease n=2 Tax=Saccharopolyspora erythraea TaxID=1836 RepID=A4FCW5_SACEN|nr:MFS transporter [Saccharopolyspora erythraea NRRL 2338]QRK93519.1 MFS transporter [Saccharopolyspora erythraea]CAM01890.1 alpha-ketoglutarate permease [Saccharopolyspora erythraea NRRL 2338]
MPRQSPPSDPRRIAQDDAEPGDFGNPAGVLERIGIPQRLFWGFVAVLIFMVGDGVETTYLSDYLQQPEGGGLPGATASFATVTLYGVAAMIAAWFSGTLSAIWGPRRVMWLGGAWWIVFEALFLFVAIPSHSATLIVAAYGVRGFAYPLFAFAFLVWAQVASPASMRGSVAGWFWFAFTGGLPTLGAAVAALAIGPLGMSLYDTLVLSMVLVSVGVLLGSFAVREKHGLQPIADSSVDNPRSLRRLGEGVGILWRDRRTLAGGLVRIVNTAPQYGFFAMFPFVFGPAAAGGGFLSAAQIASLASIAYGANIAANLFFGVFADRFGWRRTVTWFGCVGCAIATPVWYFGAVAAQNFAVTATFGVLYGVLLAGFVPLSALMPSMVARKDKGAALAVLNLGAGGAAFVGPVVVTVLYPLVGGGGVAVTFSLMYFGVALLTLKMKDESDPGERKPARSALPVTTVQTIL